MCLVPVSTTSVSSSTAAERNTLVVNGISIGISRRGPVNGPSLNGAVIAGFSEAHGPSGRSTHGDINGGQNWWLCSRGGWRESCGWADLTLSAGADVQGAIKVEGCHVAIDLSMST